MADIKLNQIKTKNLKKDKIVVTPTQIPLLVEKEFHANMRAFNTQFKKAVREQLFPLIKEFSEFTRDELFKEIPIYDNLESMISNNTAIKMDSCLSAGKFGTEEYTQAVRKSTQNILTDTMDTFTKIYLNDGIGEDINAAIEKVKEQFNFLFVGNQIANRMVSRVNIMNGKKTTRSVNNATGVDIENIIASENLSDFIELQTVKNAQLIKSVPQDVIEGIRRIILNGFTQGLRAEEITKQISGNIPSSVFNKMNNRINTIARTSVAQVNSQITNKRLLNIGVTRAVWDATNDSRVRECHRARDGKEYDIKKGLYSSCDNKTIQPGEEINCRCVARPIVE